MLLASGVFVLLAGTAEAVSTNRTIDDESGDSVTGQPPQYTTTNTTNQTTHWNDGLSCALCQVHPNATECYGQTWHDVTAYPGQTASVALSFTGTAMYVYGIVPNTVAGTATVVNLTFTLDGKPAGKYFHAPDASNNIAYNVSLFSQAGLANGAHYLTATATPGPTLPSLFMFDYAVYTSEELVASESSSGTGTASPTSVSSTSSSSATTVAGVAHRHSLGGAIGGAVGGGLVAIAALLALLLCLHRRRRPEQPTPAVATTAAIPHSPPHPGVSGGGMGPHTGHYMPPPTAYDTAPMRTFSPTIPAYHPGSYAHPECGSYASTDMTGSNAHVALRVDSEHSGTAFSHTPAAPTSWQLKDAALTSSGGPYYSPKSAPPSNVTTSTAPGSSDAPSSSPEALRRLPPAPAQSVAVRPHDSVLTRVGSMKTMSEVPPAYAPS